MGKKIGVSSRSLMIALLGLVGFGGGLSVAQHAQAADLDFASIAKQCSPQDVMSDEQCACDAALKENTIPALEEFLRKYPAGRRGSACSALALQALSQFACDGRGSHSINCGGNQGVPLYGT